MAVRPHRRDGLVKNITYQDTDTNAPTTGARTVRYVLTDGDGGTSANYDTTVTVSGANDAPVLTNGGSARCRGRQRGKSVLWRGNRHRPGQC